MFVVYFLFDMIWSCDIQCKRALTLWATESLTTIDTVRRRLKKKDKEQSEQFEAKDLKQSMFKRKAGGKSGDATTSYSKFSHDNWGKETPAYVGYVKALKECDWEEILGSAKVFIKSARATDDDEDGSEPEEPVFALPPIDASDDDLEESAPPQSCESLA